MNIETANLIAKFVVRVLQLFCKNSTYFSFSWEGERFTVVKGDNNRRQLTVTNFNEEGLVIVFRNLLATDGDFSGEFSNNRIR